MNVNPREAEVGWAGQDLGRRNREHWGNMGRGAGEGDQTGSRGFWSRGGHPRYTMVLLLTHWLWTPELEY